MQELERKIGAPVIDVVAAKAQKSVSNTAIVFCRSGLTGNPGFDGLGEVRNHYSMSKIAILVFDEADLDSLADGRSLVSILRDKYFGVKGLA